MRQINLKYWTKEPNSVLKEETRKFRNTAEACKFILEKGGIPIFVR